MTTISIEHRFKKHVTEAKVKSKRPLYRAMLKYGIENIEKKILFENDDREFLILLECEFIERFKLDGKKLYNLTNGGEGVNDPTGKIGRLIGIKAKERWGNSEFKALTSEKIKLAVNSKGHTEKLSKALRLAKDNEKSRQKQSNLSLAYWDREDYRTKCSGENKYNTKLNNQEVAKIKQMLQDGIPTREIKTKFGISKFVLSAIKTGKSWKHIPWPIL